MEGESQEHERKKEEGKVEKGRESKGGVTKNVEEKGRGKYVLPQKERHLPEKGGKGAH